MRAIDDRSDRPLGRSGHTLQIGLAMHIAGGATGGLLSGAILGLVAASLGSLLGATRLLDASLIMSPVVLIVLGASDLELWDGRLLTGSRQTPGYWSCSFGPAWGLFAWGLDLGNGMTTRIPHQVLLGVVGPVDVEWSFPRCRDRYEHLRHRSDELRRLGNLAGEPQMLVSSAARSTGANRRSTTSWEQRRSPSA